jgi:phytoene/squalene synthetase
MQVQAPVPEVDNDGAAEHVHQSATAMMATCAQDARARMHEGQPLAKRLPGRAGWELRLVVQGALRVLDKIDALGPQVLRERPRLRAWDAPIVLWRALRM